LGSAAGRLTYQQGGVDLKWAMVSNRELAGRRLSELEFPQRFGVVITRIERQGLERVPNGQSRLELGDRMALLGQEAQVMALAHELDSSPSTAAEVDLLSFSLGIALGLLLGMIVLPLPGGVSFSLGIAGGPLVVGLVLGIVGRSGPLLWLIPHGANLSLRQLGLALFLAGVGTRSGAAFFAGIGSGEGLGLLTLGAAITLLAATVILLPGYIWLKIPLGTLGGVLAGTQTQPALLGFLRERTTSALPALSYVTVFPVATLLKIVMAQVLLWL
jgi:putative transport protein